MLGQANPAAMMGMFGQANNASMMQMMLTDRQQAMTIYTQTMADAQKQMAERWKIMRETQTKVFELLQEAVVNQSKVQSKICSKWSEYFRM
ncbi:MAG: hypothetical protein AB1758_12385 [Candidatus Eremiobacterota bacterium]